MFSQGLLAPALSAAGLAFILDPFISGLIGLGVSDDSIHESLEIFGYLIYTF